MANGGIFSLLRNRVLGNIIGFGVGAAAADSFAPPFREVQAEINSLYPNLRHMPADLAAMVVQGIRPEGEAAGEATDWGLNGERFAELVRLNGNPPGPEDLLALWRRGAIDEGDVDRGIRQGRTKTEWLAAVKALRRVLLSPEFLAQAVVQGHVGQGEAARIAAQSGIVAADFERMVETAGSPPGAGELFELWNRGEIDEAQVSQGLRESRLKPKWTEPLKALARVVAPVSDVIRFAVREVYDPATVRQFGQDQDFPTDALADARKVGLDRPTFEKYWAAHWDLPSPEQGFRMLHRGIVDEKTLRRLLKALDVMPYWRERLVELAYNVPGRIDLRRMYAEGVIDKARVLRGYLDLGYSPKDAAVLTEFATRLKLAAERDLTKAEIVSLYEARTLSRSEAVDMLAPLGYDEAESGLLLGLADFRRERTFRTAATAAVRGRFLARELDRSEAETHLADLGLPPDEVEQLVDLWAFQLAETPHRLTQAQAQAALRRGLLSTAEYAERLARMGYPEEDVALLVDLAAPAA